MAKKKHHKKKSVGARKGHRRHRVGAGGKLEEAALIAVGLIGGAIVMPFMINGVQTAMGANANIPAWMVPGGGAATGAVVLGLGVSHKMPIVVGFGGGMMAVGSVMAANEMGLNEPGISGLAMSNNAPPGTSALSKAVGCNRVGSSRNYLNQTVGSHRRYRKAMAVGALISD